MKIALASSEAVPYCKTGGLADVVGALSEAFASKRHSVRLILPLYKSISQNLLGITDTSVHFQVPLGDRNEPVQIWESNISRNLKIYFIGSDRYFNRDGIYGPDPGSVFPDNDRRYILFSRAVLETLRRMDFSPEVIHCHDWQTGLLPAYIKTLYKDDPFFRETGTVFTIHNMAYQGNFPPTTMGLTELPKSEYNPTHLEFYNQISFLKAGLVYSDAVNTVSPTYAKEIISDPRYGFGLEGVLQSRRDRFSGIINGLDTNLWNPRTDVNLAVSFSPQNISKRLLCKVDLQKQVGLIPDPDVPLMAFIGRLDYQKGIDHLIEVVPHVLKEGAQFVALGQGNPDYKAKLLQLRDQYPSQVSLETSFAEPLAHKIYGGADLFLMPSRFEPCGLGQMIAMRYGALPVVNPIGGLRDTVEPVKGSKGTGFVAADLSYGAYLNEVRRALSLLKSKPEEWKEVQKRAMSLDQSWKASIPDYMNLYDASIKWRKEELSH